MSEGGICASGESLFLQLVQMGPLGYVVILPPAEGGSMPLVDAGMAQKLLHIW